MPSARRLCLFITILAVLSVVWRTQASHAATFYVATDGHDTDEGTKESPFQTIKRGARALRAGDTLIVRGGTYQEVLGGLIPSGNSWSQPVTVQAAPGETVTLQANVRTDAVIGIWDNSQYIIVDGFRLDANHLATWALVIGTASHIRVQNCEMQHARDSGMLVYGHSHEFSNLEVHDNGVSSFEHGLYLQSSQTLVESSRFYNHRGYGIHAYGGGGHANIFNSNLIHDNASGGMVVTGEENTISDNTIRNNGNGLILMSRDSRVSNNSIHDNYGTSGDRGIGIFVQCCDLGVEITDNTIYGNADGAIYGVRSATVKNNTFTD